MFETLKKNYLSTFEDKISQIEAALENSDFQVLFTLIHQLAGSSGSYGYTALSEHCSVTEALLMSGFESNSSIKPAIIKLLAMMNETKNSFKE